MDERVLGISGSPIANSNTDRAVQAVLEATGLPSGFIKLSSYRIEPCRACLGCVTTNKCVIPDDAQELLARFARAKAFVIGGFTPYSSLDARTKTFMERAYSLRHLNGLNAGKIGASVVTSACPPDKEGLPPAAHTAAQQIAFWMMEEGMKHIGHIDVLGNVPCIRCGFGDTCEMSGIKMMGGPDMTVEAMGVNAFEAESSLIAAAQALGRRIAEAL